ncbi:MAG: ABC transporter permease [Clostridia bacterium]
MNMLISIISAAITSSGAIMYASIGEVISERSGVINLGLEGIMLMGAVTGYIAVVKTGSLLLGVLAALGVGALLGLFYALVTITLRANQIVCGLAMVILGTGMSGFIGKDYAGIVSGISFSKIPLPLLSKIPVLGPALFNQDILIYCLYILVPLAMVFLYKTRPGLKLRALGENPAALDVAGINVFLLRYVYVIIGSAIVSLGGAYVTLAYTPSWYDQITAGAGWIAAALVIFSSWNPIYAFLGAILFGSVSAIGLRLQLIGVNIPSFFISMLPYICTVVVLIISTGSFRAKRPSAPAVLGKFYDREER